MPTVGRTTLAAAVASVTSQLGADDQIVVVGDGWQPHARRVCRKAREETDGTVGYCEASHPTSVFGCHQRDAALALASGSHVAFLDDDDVYLPGALDLFRDAATEQPDAIHCFRAEWGPGHHWRGILWADPVWREQNVATCMVVFPHVAAMPRWMEFNELGIVSDFGWMSAAAAGRSVEFHEPVVAVVRPEARA